ncbi:MAG: hypothetical protein ACJ72N_17320 [Labedaea sp.]
MTASAGACSTPGNAVASAPSGPASSPEGAPASATESSTPAPTTTTPAPTSSGPSTTKPRPAGAATPPPGRFPGPANTGIPAGTAIRSTVGDYTAGTAGMVIDGWHVQGSLIVKAANVTIKNSLIDDSVWNEGGSFTIIDTTVGPASCGGPTIQPDGVGEQNYTAVRVRIRGHEDGFRASGPGVVIRDSYYLACVRNGEAHADGVQDYPATQNIIIEHNTFDMGNLTNGFTAPIFVHATGTSGARIVNNLAIGGVFSLFLRPARGPWVVTGNRVVEGKYVYSPFETENSCGTVTTWADNDVVKVDPSYNVVATVRDDVACGAT